MTDSVQSPEDISLRSVFVRTSHVKAATERLQDILRQQVRYHVSSGLLLIGPSGVGKSAAAVRFANSINTHQAIPGERLPVLYFEMPASPTQKNLGSRLLHTLGDSEWGRRDTAEDKLARAAILLSHLKTDLIIIDEVQHLVDYKRTNAAEAGDWIKSLMNVSNLSIALVGMNRIKRIKEENPQFRRRFSATYQFERFYPESPLWPEFLGLIRALSKKISVDKVDFLTSDMVQRLYFCSHGIMDYLVKVLERAVTLVKDGKFPGIDRTTLYQAFFDEVWQEAPVERNPFHDQFQFKPLIAMGEPFQKVDE